MRRRAIHLAVKAGFCLLLCLALTTRTGAQTNTVPPPPAATAMAPAAAPAAVTVSIIGMARNADPIVQAVMAFLLLCSAASWAVFIYKFLTLAIAQRNTRHFSAAFAAAKTMQDEGPRVADGVARRMWLAAKQEWDATLRLTAGPLAADQTSRLLQRLVLAMGSAQERALTRLGSWMGLLATVGSTAPFIGLFGTVWGILDSFEHISAWYNTSLTVVAPGIAEALLATAVGLFAATPAATGPRLHDEFRLRGRQHARAKRSVRQSGARRSGRANGWAVPPTIRR